MNKKDLIDYYKIHMPNHLKPDTEQAIELFSVANPSFEPFDLKNIHGIQRVALKLHENKKDKKMLSPKIDFFPGSFLAAERRIKYILPEIIKIRIELFGKKEAPFNYNDAIEWLKKESKKEAIEFYKRKQLPQKDIQKLKDKIRKLIDDLNEIQQWGHGLMSKLITIPIIFKNGMRDEFITFPGTKLRKLANVINRHSQDTNFSQFSLLMFTLTGLKPTLPSYSIVQEVSSYGGKKIGLKIFRPFSQRDFMSLFKLVGKLMPRRKKIKMENLKVYEFIEERGPIPLKRKMEFWRNAWQEWNKTHLKQIYTSSSGLRMAYLRIKKKVDLS